MLGALLEPDLDELIRLRRWKELQEVAHDLHPADLADLITDLTTEDQAMLFRILPRSLASEVFAHVPAESQEQLIQSLSSEHVRSIVSEMSPDDRTHLFEELPAEVTRRLLQQLPPDELKSAHELLGYPAESAGRYMTPAYVSLGPDMTAAEALEHIRRAGRGIETLTVLYVVDKDGKLLRDLRLGTLVAADPTARIGDIDDRPLVAAQALADREEVVKTFEKYDRFALPVLDADGQMLGIITADDILDVVSEEVTEDMHKIGGLAAIDEPYKQAGLALTVRKRAGWLSVLFLGEMLTASAMAHYESEIARAVVLAMFIPLIISSGGNSGSQAATLIVRALALDELRLRDWFFVLLRELYSGAMLGTLLGVVGFLRVVLWQQLGLFDYGPQYMLVAVTVWVSLTGVVAFGTLVGSMLPFLLRRLGFDPATSSTPFVATLVDVTGVVIYFGVAAVLLRGSLL